MFCVDRKIPTLESTVPVRNPANLISHWNGGTSGWDFPVPTEHQWWILFVQLADGQVAFLRDFLFRSSYLICVSQKEWNEPRHDKTSSGVSDQARHKPACAAIEVS